MGSEWVFVADTWEQPLSVQASGMMFDFRRVIHYPLQSQTQKRAIEGFGVLQKQRSA
jgi:hypothetical protein